MRFSRVWIWPSISWTHQFGLGSCHCSFSPRWRCSGNTGVARTDPTAGGRETTPIRYQLCFIGLVSAVKTSRAQNRLHAQSIVQDLLSAQCEFAALMGKIKGPRAADSLLASYRNSERLMSRLRKGNSCPCLEEPHTYTYK